MSDWTPAQWQSEHDGRLTAMVEIARQAGQHTLTHYGKPSLSVDHKSDDSPVTIADREAEQLVRELVAKQFPDDAIAGEEFADSEGASRYRWVVDPIDGTKSFICGVPLYSTLLAVECDEFPIAGVIYLPALQQMVVGALNMNAYQTSDLETWKEARVSEQSDLSRAVFVTSEAKTFGERGEGDRGDTDVFETLQRDTWLTRTWGDGYGYAMVATGRADLMVDPICNAWDVAAIAPILAEAGGRFTSWKGVDTVRGGDGVGTNGHLHDAVLQRLQTKP
ncbi:histidinol-phosphatase [Rhodopirellula halodulae]|uniref:histidinol-phosphatase n=1 Tax=Rhodopirellula halodulae TaxID=2894198 RepID=UPI001E5B1600|nr:histidinol-phosphatase [Rhodopirellula sp. JC737]MCC9656673.1 histidinol-phosphatase [Rhodopirellula sp. JC737]